MNGQPLNEDIFAILRILSSRENLSQRDLSGRLGFSLGKTNYLLKALARIGLLEIKNFTARDKKAKKVKYLFTKRGLKERARLTYHFLKQKEYEYNLIKKEWEEFNHRGPSAIAAQKNHLEASNKHNGGIEEIG